jgi:Adenylate and Guanylate cyclase catalytic domain
MASVVEESVEEEISRLYPFSPNHVERRTSSPKGQGLVENLSESMSDLSLEEKDDRLQHRRSSDSFARLKPSINRPGERTVSTSMRLRRQGFSTLKSGSTDFAVKSIRRGSDEWNGMLRPFVSDLTFRSLEYRRFQSEVSFRPYTCHAAVLFVDLSNYSKITAEIAHKGAHAISTAVNAYLSRLLAIAASHGGDVIKFAGDAVLIVWEGEQQDLEINILMAAKCSMDMQEKAGVSIIEGSSWCFRIHCGLCCGLLESEIFIAPNHVSMQRYFHSVSGESLIEISELVDIAKSGEVCLSDTCVKYLGNRGTYKQIEDSDDCKLLTNITLDASIQHTIELHLEQVMSDRLVRRNKRIEEDFIHPSVLRLLVLGGLSPTQIAQMRNLCVLFIAMTSNGSSVNWLMEVQTILDKNRCPSTYM